MSQNQLQGIRKAAAPSSSIDSSRKKTAGLAQDDAGRKGKCFLVPGSEIRSNKYDLSISRYKEIEYEKPGIIMDRLMALEREIGKDVEGIKKMI